MSKGLTHEAAVGGTVEWYTPAWVFERLGVRFDLDPCHPAQRLPWVPADRTFCEADDGLQQKWDGSVWFNPPYTGISAWVDRFVGGGHCGLTLTFNRSDTAWCQKLMKAADAVMFVEKRICFVDATGAPPMVLKKNAKGEERLTKSGPGAGSIICAVGGSFVDALYRSKMGLVMVRG